MCSAFNPNNPMSHADQFRSMKRSIAILEQEIAAERDNYKKDTLRATLRGWQQRLEKMELTF